MQKTDEEPLKGCKHESATALETESTFWLIRCTEVRQHLFRNISHRLVAFDTTSNQRKYGRTNEKTHQWVNWKHWRLCSEKRRNTWEKRPEIPRPVSPTGIKWAQHSPAWSTLQAWLCWWLLVAISNLTTRICSDSLPTYISVTSGWKETERKQNNENMKHGLVWKVPTKGIDLV